MGGCTNCAGKDGCTDRKSVMLGDVEQALDFWYPSRRFGETRDAFGNGYDFEDTSDLADLLAETLGAATWVRAGSDRDRCNFIYVLCMGRQPPIGAIRDIGVAPGVDFDGTQTDLCLRIAVSELEAMAAVQQVAFTLETAQDALVITETPRAGVYDAPLLKRFRKLVAALGSTDLVHVDMGEISHPPNGFTAEAYATHHGAPPDIVNYLFYAEPSNTSNTVVLTTLRKTG